MSFYIKPLTFKRKIYNALIKIFKIFLIYFSIKKRSKILNPNKILYICMAERGDIVMSSASINYLKSEFPKSEIYYACKESYTNIANLINTVDIVIPLNKLNSITKIFIYAKQIYTLRNFKFDIVFDETGSIFSTIFWRLINPNNAYSINQHELSFLASDYINLVDGCDILLRRKMLLELYFKQINYTFKPKFLINVHSDVLEANQLEVKNFITFQPYGGWPEKSLNNYLLLSFINNLIDIYNLPIVFLGGEKEFYEIQKCIESIKFNSFKNFAGKLSISNSVFFVKNSLLHVGVDSFLRHVSIAVDTPSLTIFGPTSHLLSGYRDKYHESIFSDINCRPFLNQYCILDAGRKCSHLSCMKNIDDILIKNKLQIIKNIILKNE